MPRLSKTPKEDSGKKKKSSKSKSSRLSRRSNKSKSTTTVDELDQLALGFNTDEKFDYNHRDSPRDVCDVDSPTSVMSKDGTQRIITSQDGGYFPPSALRESFSFDPTLKSNVPVQSDKSTMVLKEAPSAREAAFSGPPRYDWIDIETAAALKVQSIFRRNQVLEDIEARGMLTKGMKNRRRARNSKKNNGDISDDVPTCMRFCGIGYLFGDLTEESDEVIKQKRIVAFEEKRRQKQAKEEEARKYRWRNRETEEVIEGYEVVDDTRSTKA